jgi:hypothetical protein
MQKSSKEKFSHNRTEVIFCCWCNQPTSIVWLHGHGQCSNCGINIDECCSGENIEFESNKKNDTGEK